MSVLGNNEWDQGITIEGYSAKKGEGVDPHFNAVSAGYVNALGIHILAGRNFTPKDDANSPQVALVNESFARRYFGNSPAVAGIIPASVPFDSLAVRLQSHDRVITDHAVFDQLDFQTRLDTGATARYLRFRLRDVSLELV